VANLLAFHNVAAMTKAVRRMEADGFEVRDECVAQLSPYQTEHIDRFGHYTLNFDRTPTTPSLDFRKPPQSQTVEGSPKVLVMPNTAGQRT
jgi:Tn3 transposase DDE domain